MSYTVRDLRMDYHMETGTHASINNALVTNIDDEVIGETNEILEVDIEYLSWVEEEAARLRSENKELLEMITNLTKS